MKWKVKAELIVEEADTATDAKREFWDWIDDWMPGQPEDGKLEVELYDE